MQVVVEGLAKAADMACHIQLRVSHDSQVPHSRIAHWDVTPSYVNCWDIDMLHVLFSTANDDFCFFIVQLQLFVSRPILVGCCLLDSSWL